ncbi:MAG TPA: hypothetical protein VJR94_06040, partial [Candidatus Nitrosocosmicus sp.]|nr:hypothetical protein [Candidatus Nitrosocosmicus sp.]
KNLEYVKYEVQKKKDHSKNHDDGKSDGVLDKAKEKALEFKDSVVDTTKQQLSSSNEQSQ